MLGRIREIDKKVIDNIGRIHTPALTKLMVFSSWLGNLGLVWWVIGLPFFIIPKMRLTGFNYLFGMVMALIAGEGIIKHIVKRVRPCHYLGEDEQIISPPRFYSFPSGHTTASFAFVGITLLRCSFFFLLPIIVIASLISFSRIYLRVHYLTDVIFGVFLGLGCGIISVLVFNSFITSAVLNLTS